MYPCNWFVISTSYTFNNNNNLFIFRGLHIQYNYLSNIWFSVKLNNTIKHIQCKRYIQYLQLHAVDGYLGTFS